MYEELIKSLRLCREILHEDDSCIGFVDGSCEAFPICAFQLMEKAADAIEELQAQLMFSNDAAKAIAEKVPKWIPVTERLPECDLGAEVGNIEWISCGMVHAGCFGRGGKYRDVYFRTWTDAGEGMDAKDADCWRAVTLPEPPKEE